MSPWILPQRRDARRANGIAVVGSVVTAVFLGVLGIEHGWFFFAVGPLLIVMTIVNFVVIDRQWARDEAAIEDEPDAVDGTGGGHPAPVSVEKDRRRGLFTLLAAVGGAFLVAGGIILATEGGWIVLAMGAVLSVVSVPGLLVRRRSDD